MIVSLSGMLPCDLRRVARAAGKSASNADMDATHASLAKEPPDRLGVDLLWPKPLVNEVHTRVGVQKHGTWDNQRTEGQIRTLPLTRHVGVKQSCNVSNR